MKRFLNILFNPTLGLFPVIIQFVAFASLSLDNGLIAGAILYGIYFFISFLIYKNSSPYMLVMLGITFITLLLLTFFDPFKEFAEKYTVFIFEIIFVIYLWIITLSQRTIHYRFFKENSKQDMEESLRFSEFFRTSKMCRDMLSCHVLLAIVYKFLLTSFHSVVLDEFIYTDLILLLVVGLCGYELIHFYWLQREISKEDWLPIVDETGKVIGKVAVSVSRASEKRYLHPVIRISMIKDGLLYLKKREGESGIFANTWDYPFETQVRYEATLDDTIRELLAPLLPEPHYSIRFVFRYIFRNLQTNRLIYFYTLDLTGKEVDPEGGKWWTQKQIIENLHKGVFSEFFEKEFEILRTTILFADKVIKESNESPVVERP